ncbi:Nop14-like protein [Lentinus tigrinus ALCF2SS1-7]|uniref:Nop14-like protein n=1 Tax=Lentinus tigrinus ALCF2SS1-6 TaxID=1328759 RepID=A0A5C2STD0_9APHY|nr:Nop14-like protein [Lentinus tigrinus ALCF2SS1-6]RPD80844.1 Nop14-like protein [Lentinus tigrinus ALCF2SS1-7]
MAKGSQLKQLKSALQQAGLTQQPQAGKKRKRAAPTERDKEKKAARLQEIQQKLNPFDVKVTKVKHDVGGRKIAGTTGRPAQSKQAGIEQRKKTLLKEFEEKDHSGGIVDRRFGENDPTMTPEERMLERFTRERQRASKGVAFNLEDEDELTHYGQSLSKLDDFDNVGLGLDDDDEEEGQVDKQTVERSHFGGFGEDEDEGDDHEDEPARKKSKAEVMAEVIAKSKQHKLLRQTQQEEDENLRHELDNELDSIRSLLFAPPPAENPATPSTDAPAPAPLAAPPPEDQDKEYDQYVRELALDRRAKPKDRTKTEEELALEEKEALEKAEQRRLRRMRGEESESEDEQPKGKRKQARPRGGDDLDDDFNDEEQTWGGLGAGLGDDVAMAGAEDQDEGSDENEGQDSEEEGDEETSGEEEDEQGSVAHEFQSASEESGEEDGEEGESEALVDTKRTRRKKLASVAKELPYTFPCPETHDEFLEIIEDIDEKDIPTVVRRIRTLHHPSLAEENKFKLQGLNTVLIEHILYITSPPTPRHTVLTSLLPHLAALTKSYPIQSAGAFVEKLNLMHKNLKRGLSKGALDPEAKTWPGIPELSLLRVIGQLWPTSDMNHPVISPTRLLMGAYLGLGRVRRLQDIASGLFLCSLFLQYEKLSKRFIPEAINFLVNSVLHLAPHSFTSVDSLPGSFPVLDFRTTVTLPLTIDVKKARKLSLKKPNPSQSLCELELGEQGKVDLLGLSLELLSRFADLYKGLDGFAELFTPVGDILAAVKSSDLPSELSTRMQSLQDTLGRLLKFALQARRPLRLQAHKPIPIPTYVPKFEHTTSNYLRNRDPDHERNEAAKLRAQYKQERKGAIRELRKDARFLAGEQQKKEKEKDRMYNERMKRMFGSIESERAEEKASEREKMKEKRRAGRK